MALFNRLFAKYIDQYKNCDKEVKAFLDNNQIDEAHLLVHSIKGTSANLGVTCMWNAAAELDKVLKVKDVEAVPPLYEVFCQTLQEVLAEVAAKG